MTPHEKNLPQPQGSENIAAGIIGLLILLIAAACVAALYGIGYLVDRHLIGERS